MTARGPANKRSMNEEKKYGVEIQELVDQIF